MHRLIRPAKQYWYVTMNCVLLRHYLYTKSYNTSDYDQPLDELLDIFKQLSIEWKYDGYNLLFYGLIPNLLFHCDLSNNSIIRIFQLHFAILISGII